MLVSSFKQSYSVHEHHALRGVSQEELFAGMTQSELSRYLDWVRRRQATSNLAAPSCVKRWAQVPGLF